MRTENRRSNIAKLTVRVDGARHTVGDFDVKLGDNVLCTTFSYFFSDSEHSPRTRVDRSLADVPHRRALDHVPHGEALDGFVLAHAS